MHAISRLILGTCLLYCVLGTGRAQGQWVHPPSQTQLDQTPGLLHQTYESPLMKATVGYSVVLPAGYEESQRRYPVVYWLHGGGGNECSSLFTARPWRKLTAAGEIGAVILVYPSGYRSGYMDHHDGKVMAESMIIRELIPRIDGQFRTLAQRAGRAVHGFSMGASGSLKFAIKYPDLFCAAVAYGGGAIDLEKDKSTFIVNILKRNLNSNPTLIRQNNTYHFLARNHAHVRRNKIPFLLVCGDQDSWKESAVSFQAALRHHQIPCDLTLVPAVGHSLKPLVDVAGEAAARFQDQVFRSAAAR